MPASQPKKKPRTNKARKISKNCPHCGAPLGSGEEAKQCSYCGSSLVSTRQSRAKEKKENQKLLQRIKEIAEADGHPSKLSIGLNNGWAIASLLLGILAMAGFFMPPICSPLNAVGLIAGFLGRKSPMKAVVISGIVLNGVGLMLNIAAGTLFFTIGSE